MLMRTYLDAAEAAHAELTRIDQVAGDGDFGDNLRDGLRGAVARIPDDADLATEVSIAATWFLDHVGGTSGPLIGLLLQAIAPHLAEHGDTDTALRDGLADGLAAIERVGEAKVGDRTMVDCLAPTLADIRDKPVPLDWPAVARSAARHAHATADLQPRMGRASYVGDRAVGTPDAGAVGIALLFWALAVHRDPGERELLPDPARLAEGKEQP
ncbi:DAK2 domain-containing protein [Micromonospora sp. NPDC049900]|uniref:DAK2 domain-containing protein n=1 Tax=Micromonospora sp. NPDC049900 TaxID=3364275 RepID=UPI00378BC7E0